jgi:hypothetical protein
VVSPKLRLAPPMINPAEIAISRFFGFTADSKNPSPKLLAAVMESIADIHFGISGCSPSAGRPRHCFTAKYSNSVPKMILITPWTGDEPEGSCWGSTDDSKVNNTIAMTMPASQPSRKPTLVVLALGDSSVKIAAMIGIGLIAIPIANGKISPMTPTTRFS